MKTTLTKEQSARLIELGVPKEKASVAQTTIAAGDNIRGIVKIPTQPIFTLTDLLEMLPKEIENRFCIKINWNFLTETWGIEYEYTNDSFHSAKELIDALYDLTCWCLENKLELKI